MAVTRKDRMREQEAQAFEGFYPEPNPDDPDRRFGMNIYNKMSSGEIYAPDPMTGAGGDFISPGQDMYGRQDEQQLLQGSGYYDAMAAQQPPEQGFMRLNNIADLTGATIDNRNPLYRPQVQLNQDKIAAYNALSDADKMGLDMINNGTMTGEKWYAIKKKEEKDLRDAMIEMAKENAAGTTYSKDGKRVSTSADVINEFSRIGGDVTAEIEKPESVSRQIITSGRNENITGGGGRAIKGASPENDEEWLKYSTKSKGIIDALTSTKKESVMLQNPLTETMLSDQAATMFLAQQLRNDMGAKDVPGDISPAEAEVIARLAVSSGIITSVKGGDVVIADEEGAGKKLNLSATVTDPRTKKVHSISAYLTEINPNTGKFYTVEEIVDIVSPMVYAPR